MLVALMILSSTLAVPLCGKDLISDYDSINNKIIKELKEIMSTADSDTLIPVFIFRRQLTENEINSMIRSETNISFDTYSYDQEIIIGSPVENDMDASMYNTYSTDSLIQERADVDAYLSARRTVVKNKYTELNTDFEAKYIPDNRKIFYSGLYSSTFIVEATVDEILQYARLDEVEEIAYYDDTPPVESLDISSSQVKVDRNNGTKSTKYNGGTGYTGSGIIIGVIEAGGNRYDPNAPQLSDINGTRLKYIDNVRKDGTIVSSTISPHATNVVTIIVGQPCTVNGVTYEGVVPDATVYQTSVLTNSDMCTAFNTLVEKGVKVINYSAESSATGYSSVDKEIDRLVDKTGVTFVCSVGNTKSDSTHPNLTASPARALNVIAVGNADTKSSSSSGLTAPCSIYSSSRYEDLSHLPNKPDVVAPGHYIRKVTSANTVTSGTGTSYSAPIVTGIVAQAMQAYSKLVTSPLGSKALIALSADYSLIQTNNGNSAVGNYLYEKSGAGFVIATNFPKTRLTDNAFISNVGQQRKTNATDYVSGQKTRAVMVFGKNNDSSIGNSSGMDNVDLELVNATNGQVVASSYSTNNNVEIIEYTIQTNGSYYLRFKCISKYDSSKDIPFVLALRVS